MWRFSNQIRSSSSSHIIRRRRLQTTTTTTTTTTSSSSSPSFTTKEGHRPTIVLKRSLDILHDPWFNKVRWSLLTQCLKKREIYGFSFSFDLGNCLLYDGAWPARSSRSSSSQCDDFSAANRPLQYFFVLLFFTFFGSSNLFVSRYSWNEIITCSKSTTSLVTDHWCFIHFRCCVHGLVIPHWCMENNNRKIYDWYMMWCIL